MGVWEEGEVVGCGGGGGGDRACGSEGWFF